MRVIATGIPHPETVAVGADGMLYTGTSVGRHDGAGPVVRVDPTSGAATTFVDTGGRVLGIAATIEPGFVLCDVGLAELAWIDPRGGRRATVRAAGGTPLRRPNGCVVDAGGAVWFTDSGTAAAGEPTGAVCYAPPGGGSAVVAAPDLVYPNGIGLAPDGTTLFVTLTRDDTLLALEVRGPGRLGPARVVTDRLAHGPDGLAVTPDGTVLVALTRTSRVVAARTTGQVDVVVEAPDLLAMPSHVAVHGGRLLVPSLFGSAIVAFTAPDLVG